jgi:hypothetical protein
MQNGGSVRGYQAIFVPLAALSNPGYSPMGGQPAVYLYVTALEANCPLLPPTGSSRPPWHWHLCPQVHAGRGRHPDGEADRRLRRKGRAAGTQARTIHLPQAPWTWIRAGDNHQPWIIGVPRIRQTAMPGNSAQSRPPLRSSKRLPGTSVSIPGITLSDEGSQGERARTRLCAAIGLLTLIE